MFCVRWTGCPVHGSELLADRTTEMFYADGRRETVQDRIYGDPCESRRLTAEEWIGQTIFYKRMADDQPEEEEPKLQPENEKVVHE
jgi:hypothetical protein